MSKQPATLPTQKDELARLMVDSGLDIGDFDWIDEKKRYNIEVPTGIQLERLVHKDKGFYFLPAIDVNQNRTIVRFVEYAPGESSALNSKGTKGWPEQLVAAEGWIANLKRELATPD